MPIPPPLRRNDHSGIDRSVCGRTASCAFAANNQFYLPFRHFPIGEINSLFLRKFAYVLSIVGGIFPRIFHCREAGEKWRNRNHFIRRESKGKNRGGGREKKIAFLVQRLEGLFRGYRTDIAAANKYRSVREKKPFSLSLSLFPLRYENWMAVSLSNNSSSCIDRG